MPLMRGGPLTQSPIFVGFTNYCSHFNHNVFIPKAYRCLGAVREACPPTPKEKQQQQQKNKQTRDSLSIRSSGTGRPSTVCEDFCSDSRAVTTLRGKHQWAEALEPTKIEEKKKPMSSSLSIHMLFTVFLTRERRPGEPGHGDNFALSAECSGV